jgi:hypothetical protein
MIKIRRIAAVAITLASMELVSGMPCQVAMISGASEMEIDAAIVIIVP